MTKTKIILADTTDVETLHLRLIRDIGCFWPDRIIGTADALAVKDRAEHIREVLDIVNGYVAAMAADTAAHAPQAAIDCQYVDDMLSGTAADVVAHISRVADRLPRHAPRSALGAPVAVHAVAAE